LIPLLIPNDRERSAIRFAASQDVCVSLIPLDPSLDLLVRSLLVLGVTRQGLAKIVARRSAA